MGKTQRTNGNWGEAQREELAKLIKKNQVDYTNRNPDYVWVANRPLVADSVVDRLVGGAGVFDQQFVRMARQALHATHLELAHPVSRAPLVFDCPPPADFAQAWQQVCG